MPENNTSRASLGAIHDDLYTTPITIAPTLAMDTSAAPQHRDRTVRKVVSLPAAPPSVRHASRRDQHILQQHPGHRSHRSLPSRPAIQEQYMYQPDLNQQSPTDYCKRKASIKVLPPLPRKVSGSRPPCPSCRRKTKRAIGGAPTVAMASPPLPQRIDSLSIWPHNHTGGVISDAGAQQSTERAQPHGPVPPSLTLVTVAHQETREQSNVASDVHHRQHHRQLATPRLSSNTTDLSPASSSTSTKPESSPSRPQPQHPSNTRYMNMLVDAGTIPRMENILASLFAWLLLAGLVILPASLTSASHNHLHLLSAATTLAGLGLIGLVALALRRRKNYVWLLNRVFLPAALNAFAGLLAVCVAVYSGAIGWEPAVVVAAAVEGGVGVVSVVLFVVYNNLLLRRVRMLHRERRDVEKQIGLQAVGLRTRLARMAAAPPSAPGSVV